MALELAPGATGAQRRALAGPYRWIGLGGSLIIAVTAPLWRLSGPTWRLTLPGVPHNGVRPFTAIAFVAGASMLSIAWFGLISRVERSELPRRDRLRAVVATSILWFAPLMFGPPLLSSDIYSYAAEGAMVTQGHDPTVEDMSLLHYGVDPPVAVAIGIANPITVLHLVGGSHNDALLMALLVTGCAFALRGRWPLGVLFIALATGVKLPAAAAIVYLGWERAGIGAAFMERVRSVARSLAGAGAVIGALCIVVGISLFGWIQSMQNSGKTMGTLSLPTRVGYLVSSILRLLHLPANDGLWIGLFRFVGLSLAAYICLRLLGLTHRIGAVQCAALSMLAVVLLGPVVWPWYLAPAIGLLGAAGVGRWRPSLLVLTVAFAFEVFPVGPKAKPVLEGSHIVSLLLILVIAAATLAAPLAVEWWREVRGVPGDEPPLAGPAVPFAPAD